MELVNLVLKNSERSKFPDFKLQNILFLSLSLWQCAGREKE